MIELLLPFIIKFAPYFIMIVGAMGAYYAIKSKGKAEEREAQKKREEEALARVSARLREVGKKDREIDDRVAKAIKEKHEVDKKSDPSRFNF
jgi:hypothetical protein